MATLRSLIKGQNVVFDTHQSGDGQPVHWKHLHLEKRLHGKRGKIRVPLFGNFQPTTSKLSQDDSNRVLKEVKRALSRDPKLVESLSETIAYQIHRFKEGSVNREDAGIAARKIASAFGLSEDFVILVESQINGQLSKFITLHVDPSDRIPYEIEQGKSGVSIRTLRVPRRRAGASRNAV